MIGATTQTGEHGNPEEQDQDRADGNGKSVAGDSRSTGDRAQFVLRA